MNLLDDKNMSFFNKVVLVTGGSSGIGAHAAGYLSKKGANIALVGRNIDRLNAVADQIKREGAPTTPKPLVIEADITKDAERIITETINCFGQLNVLINSAGIYASNSVENIDMDEYDRIMNTNLRSAIEISKFAVPYLAKTKGNILNVSSTTGFNVKPNFMANCISKAGINQLTKSAALDLASKGIRVNAINPSIIRTPTFERGMNWTPEQAEEYFQSLNTVFPLQRAGECSDTSAAIEYLCGDGASFITGLYNCSSNFSKQTFMNCASI